MKSNEKSNVVRITVTSNNQELIKGVVKHLQSQYQNCFASEVLLNDTGEFKDGYRVYVYANVGGIL